MVVVSAPAAMMLPATGAMLIAVTGIGLAASVPLAGALVEAPWMLVAFFAIAATASTYLLSDAQMTNGWRMVQIFVLSSFWTVVFDAKDFGWSVAYAFSSALVGFSFIMLFDNVLWPDPPIGICSACWPQAPRGFASGSPRWAAATLNRRAPTLCRVRCWKVR